MLDSPTHIHGSIFGVSVSKGPECCPRDSTAAFTSALLIRPVCVWPVARQFSLRCVCCVAQVKS